MVGNWGWKGPKKELGHLNQGFPGILRNWLNFYLAQGLAKGKKFGGKVGNLGLIGRVDFFTINQEFLGGVWGLTILLGLGSQIIRFWEKNHGLAWPRCWLGNPKGWGFFLGGV